MSELPPLTSEHFKDPKNGMDLILANMIKQPDKIEKTARDLKLIMKQAQRKLLELEVFLNEQEIKEGKFKVYKNAKELMADLKK